MSALVRLHELKKEECSLYLRIIYRPLLCSGFFYVRKMRNERKLRGFQILENHRKSKKSICLFRRNGDRYIVLINYYFLGIRLKSRQYEFSNLALARATYRRLVNEPKPEGITAPLVQKQSVGF